jgi:invasion protein IalB
MQRILFFLICMSLSGWTGAVLAQSRIALVVGNSKYANILPLRNPRNDAKAISNLFTAAKFDVVEDRYDVGNQEFRRILRDFAVKSAHADIAVIYFSGHGIEVAGNNYLIPIDARLATDLEVEDEAVSLDRALRIVDPTKRLKLIILDACRENPFIPKMQRISPTRSVGRGFAAIEVETNNTLVAYAAKAGSIALDGHENNSPFTKALLKHLGTPGLDIRLAFGKVRDDVVKETNRQQEPFVYGTLGGDVISLVPGSQPLAAPSPKTDPKSQSNENNMGTVRSMHGNWQVRCTLVGTPPQDRCVLTQSVSATDRDNVGLTIILVKNEKQELRMHVVAPLELFMPSGLGLTIDGMDVGRAGFVRCLANGCVAEVTVDRNLLNKLETGSIATFIFFQAPETGLGFPISLSGLAAGLGELR